MLEFKEKYLFIFVQNFLLTKLRKYDIMEFRLAYVCGRAAKKNKRAQALLLFLIFILPSDLWGI